MQTSWAGHFLWVSGWAVSLGLSLGSSLVLSLGSFLGLSSGSSLGLEQRDFGQGWSFEFELGQLLWVGAWGSSLGFEQRAFGQRAF